MNRSLRELKFCFMAGLPLLCAGRALDRLNLLLIEPIAAQTAIFGRVVAYPWQFEKVESWMSEDGISTAWSYKLPAFPKPLKQCKVNDWEEPRNASAINRSCSLAWDGGDMGAGWQEGILWMRFDPQHIDPSAEADNQ